MLEAGLPIEKVPEEGEGLLHSNSASIIVSKLEHLEGAVRYLPAMGCYWRYPYLAQMYRVWAFGRPLGPSQLASSQP